MFRSRHGARVCRSQQNVLVEAHLVQRSTCRTVPRSDLADPKLDVSLVMSLDERLHRDSAALHVERIDLAGRHVRLGTHIGGIAAEAVPQRLVRIFVGPWPNATDGVRHDIALAPTVVAVGTGLIASLLGEFLPRAGASEEAVAADGGREVGREGREGGGGR